jgi:hypothetical protein
VASDEVDCSQFAHSAKLTAKGTIHAFGLPEPPGAAIAPPPDVTTTAAHFYRPIASQSRGVDDVVLADEGRQGNTHALALAVSNPVDIPVGATEPEIPLTQPASPTASVTAHGERSRRQRGPTALRW